MKYLVIINDDIAEIMETEKDENYIDQVERVASKYLEYFHLAFWEVFEIPQDTKTIRTLLSVPRLSKGFFTRKGDVIRQ